MVYLLTMVIIYSYVRLPEGTEYTSGILNLHQLGPAPVDLHHIAAAAGLRLAPLPRKHRRRSRGPQTFVMVDQVVFTAFQRFDQDGSGYITGEELTKVLQSLEPDDSGHFI
jgi:hypothetical protein